MRPSIGELSGPRMVHCQSDMEMSSLLDRPKLTDISPTPFSAFSSSSRSTKLRGTTTTSPELLPIMFCHAEQGKGWGRRGSLVFWRQQPVRRKASGARCQRRAFPQQACAGEGRAPSPGTRRGLAAWLADRF
eukprot:scaffold73277_cov69-Phaeocystis_antarctica.AAC.3